MLSTGTDKYLASVTNPNNETTSLGYATGGLLTSLTDARGGLHSFTYDGLGRLIKDTDPVGGFTSLSRTETSGSFTVTTSSALGRTNTYEVQNLSDGSEKRINTNPAGLASTSVKTAAGVKTITNPDGTVIKTTDGPDPRFGMLAPIITNETIKTPSGLTYTATSTRITTLTDPANLLSLAYLRQDTAVNNRNYVQLYNAGTSTSTATSISPVGRKVTSTLDANGRLQQRAVTGLTPVDFTYNANGRLASIGQGPRKLTIAYNTLNEVSSIIDALGSSATFSYDLAGRLASKILADGRAINYGYDANGNVVSITPPSRPAHVFTFTPVDLNDGYTPPMLSAGTGLGGVGAVGAGGTTGGAGAGSGAGGGGATLYAYNLDKELTRITRSDASAIDFTYDNGGRLSAVSYPTLAKGGQGGFDAINYAYNAATGNLSSITAPAETLNYTFDGPLLTNTTWSGAVAGSVGFIYNNVFRVTSENVNSADTVSFTYDNDGLLTSVTSPVNSGGGTLSLTRDAQNGLLTGTTLGGVSTSQTYNTFGEVATYSAKISATTLLNEQYTRDNLGRITKKTETIDNQTFTYDYAYDIAGRLTQVSLNGAITAQYTYDANGNRVGRATPTNTLTSVYDNQDRLLSYGANTYTYSANGELASKTSATGTTTYAYDGLGNLTTVTLPDATQINYITDGQNRRIGKKVNGTLAQAFLYENQLRPVAELDSAGNIVSRFVNATKINVPDYIIRNGVTYSVITDHLGSPRMVVDATTGVVAQKMDYDEFGQVILDTNPGFQPFGFAGGLYDTQTRLTRFGARDYDAETGRWTTKDPIGFGGGDTNLYGYVLGDPVNFLDPEGLYLRDDLIKKIVKHVPKMEKEIIIFSKYLNEGALYSILKDLDAMELARQAAIKQAGRVGLGTAGIILGDLIFPDELGVDEMKMLEDWREKQKKCQ